MALDDASFCYLPQGAVAFDCYCVAGTVKGPSYCEQPCADLPARLPASAASSAMTTSCNGSIITAPGSSQPLVDSRCALDCVDPSHMRLGVGSARCSEDGEWRIDAVCIPPRVDACAVCRYG